MFFALAKSLFVESEALSIFFEVASSVLLFGFWCYLLILEWLVFLYLMYLLLLWVING